MLQFLSLLLCYCYIRTSKVQSLKMLIHGVSFGSDTWKMDLGDTGLCSSSLSDHATFNKPPFLVFTITLILCWWQLAKYQPSNQKTPSNKALHLFSSSLWVLYATLPILFRILILCRIIHNKELCV